MFNRAVKAGLVGIIVTLSPLSAMAEGTAVIKGKVTLKGGKEAAIKRTVVQMTADAFCQKAHEKKVGSENSLVSKDGEIENVIVYVKDGLGDAKFPTPTEKVTIDQQGCMYKPHVLTVQTNQPFVVLNSDETLHNIHGLPQKNEEFNFGQPKKGMEKELTFKRGEIFKVKCDVHPWMSAYVGVFEHPFSAVTNDTGAFELKNLPAGEYEIAIWHEEYGEGAQKVKVGDGETKELSFEMSPPNP